jgi:hypothetical protein
MDCAEGRLSLAKERGRVRVVFKTPLIIPTPDLHPLPFCRGERQERVRVCWFNVRDQAAELATPNILWPEPPEPLQIV